MDIYSFINSNAISNHCRNIEHQFTPVEMAYLIHESEKHTIPEKHAAFRELIKTTPDVAVEVGGWKSEFDSLHSFLNQYMQLKNKYLERFYRNEPDCTYSYEYDILYRHGSHKRNGRLHRNYDTCYQEFKKDRKDGDEKIADIRITKQWLMEAENDFCDMTLHITGDNLPVELEMYRYLEGIEEELERTWEDLWPVMPTPFKKGDILVYRSRSYEEVLVIDWLPYWEDKDMCSRGLFNYRESPHTKAYRQSDKDGSISWDTAPIYMNLEYYKGELNGKKRILKMISSYLKGEINFEVLIGAYSFLMCDEYVEAEDTHMYALLGDALFKGKAGVRGPFEGDEKSNALEDIKRSTVSGIYAFINSNAIAKYCSQLNHQFTSVEIAYLIHQSEQHTIPEKHDAFRKLIETTPDVELKARPCTPHFDSLHDFLKRYMRIEDNCIDLFYKDEPNCIYSFKYLHRDDSKFTEARDIYPDFHSCYEQIKMEIDDPAEMIDLRVTKQWISQGDKETIQKLTLRITPDNTPIGLWETIGCMKESEEKIYMAFDGLWPEIPTPFKKGDILVAKSKHIIDPDPFVLDRLPYWTEDGSRQRCVDLHRESGDSSDMDAMGYSQEWYGSLCYGAGPNYLQMDYYREDLIGPDRILIAVSEFLKGELDIEALMYAYDLLKCKLFADEERWHLETFGDEICVKAGIKEEKTN